MTDAHFSFTFVFKQALSISDLFLNDCSRCFDITQKGYGEASYLTRGLLWKTCKKDTAQPHTRMTYGLAFQK